MQMKNLYYFFSLEILVCMGYGKDKKKTLTQKKHLIFKNICKYETDQV